MNHLLRSKATCLVAAVLCAFTVSVFCLAAGPAAANPTPAETGAEVISLRFGWPVGLKGTVRTRKIQERTDRPSPKDPPWLVYSFEVKEHAKGLLVDAGPGRLEGGEADPSDPSGGLSAALRKVTAGGVPDEILSKSGEWLAFDDYDALRKSLDEALAGVLDASEIPDEVRAQIKGVMDQALTEEVLRAQAQSNWNAIVGAWLDADLELGAAYELTAAEPIPLLGNAPIAMRTQFSVAERTKCREEDTGSRCVRLTSRTVPEEEALKEGISKFVDQMVVAMGKEAVDLAPMIKSMDTENRLELITEPGTLLPHRVTLSQTVNITSSAGPDGKTVDVDMSSKQIFEYAYEGR